MIYLMWPGTSRTIGMMEDAFPGQDMLQVQIPHNISERQVGF